MHDVSISVAYAVEGGMNRAGDSDAEASRARRKSTRSISVRRPDLPDWAKRRIERDPEFALYHYEKQSGRARRKYGPDAPPTLNLRQEYAVALHRNGDSEKAEAELAAVLASRGPAPDVSDEFTRYGKEWHARVLYALGRFDEAEREWRDLAAECDRLLGPDHPDSIDGHENHALTLARLDRVAEAEAEMAGVVEKNTAAGGSDVVTALRSRTSHAVYLSTLGRLAESEAAWRGLAEAKGRVLGADHADTILAREALAAALYDQRRLQEAAAEYGEVAALRAATVGADHPDAERARGWQADIQRELNGPDQASIAD
jgi:eukaryotic-like serine/threonine-protein kinase